MPQGPGTLVIHYYQRVEFVPDPRFPAANLTLLTLLCHKVCPLFHIPRKSSACPYHNWVHARNARAKESMRGACAVQFTGRRRNAGISRLSRCDSPSVRFALSWPPASPATVARSSGLLGIRRAYSSSYGSSKLMWRGVTGTGLTGAGGLGAAAAGRGGAGASSMRTGCGSRVKGADSGAGCFTACFSGAGVCSAALRDSKSGENPRRPALRWQSAVWRSGPGSIPGAPHR